MNECYMMSEACLLLMLFALEIQMIAAVFEIYMEFIQKHYCLNVKNG